MKMKSSRGLLIILFIAVLGMSGCSQQVTVSETETKIEKESEADTTNETIKSKTSPETEKGLDITSLTIDGETVYLENLTLRDLVIFLQKAGYTCEVLGTKLEPGMSEWVSVTSRDDDDISLTIYNSKNEEITYGDCRIQSLYFSNPKEMSESIYVLNGLVNTKSDTQEVIQAFRDLGIEYNKKEPLPQTTAFAEEEIELPTINNTIVEETDFFIAKETFPTGQEAEIEIYKMSSGTRSIAISLPMIYD